MISGRSRGCEAYDVERQDEHFDVHGLRLDGVNKKYEFVGGDRERRLVTLRRFIEDYRAYRRLSGTVVLDGMCNALSRAFVFAR